MLKKPACAAPKKAVPIDEAYPHLFKVSDAKNKPRGAFTSYAYDKVRALCDDRKKEAYATAADIWDAVNA